MFRKARNFAVLGGNFTAVKQEIHEGLTGLQILSNSPYVVHGAIHDSGQRYPPSECHPGTREDVLNVALRWVDQSLDESRSEIFWLSGPAGVGKTAIAQSLCQRLKELGRLGGDFFLSRSVAGHNDLHTLFPTLAYQLARIYPEFGLDLANVIKSDESVLTKNMELQLKQLIVDPLKRASRNKSDIPLVLVIDGLDEAGGERDQTLLLQLLQSSFVGHRLPLKIILTSRPEPWIKSVFGCNPLSGSTWCHFLHRTTQTDKDIRKVLQFGFANIQKTHDLMNSLLESWPSSEVIDEIVDRASGQFIYASTLLRYVEDPHGNPAERLSWIVKMPSEGFIDSPFLALDNLYKHVLSTSSNLDRTLTILGAIIASFRRVRISDYGLPYIPSQLSSSPLPMSPLRLGHDPDSGQNSSNSTPFAYHKTYHRTDESVSLPIDRIERILNLRVADGLLALRTIQSLVDVPSNVELGVKFYHKSFQDFLLDPNRSGEYFINIAQMYSKIMVGSCRLLRDFEQSTTKSEQSYEDLRSIDSQWVEWWLSSAASDQNWLLSEIKAIDKTAFRRNYAKRIARKIFSFFPKKNLPEDELLLLEECKRNGNIAEMIYRDTNRRPSLSLSSIRLRSVWTVFGTHLFLARRNPRQRTLEYTDIAGINLVQQKPLLLSSYSWGVPR